MDNRKKIIHNSGALGMLVKNGMITKVEPDSDINQVDLGIENISKATPTYFKTQSGIEFTENELMFIDPKECEPWKYANRLADEMGNLDELVQSIDQNNQLQPALLRPHPQPHDGIKYEIIFGRRRHLACLQLGIKFLVIIKNISSVQDAIAAQDAENKLRKDVSNYSNAMLYKKLLLDGVFKTEKELAVKLGMSASSFNDLMSYAKIPADITRLISDVHSLSIAMAVKIANLLTQSKSNRQKILDIANQIGTTINSPHKLEKYLLQSGTKQVPSLANSITIITSNEGKKLFTLKNDHRGAICVVLDKSLEARIDKKKLCAQLKAYLETV